MPLKVAIAGPWTQVPGAAFARVSATAQQVDGLSGGRFDAFTEYGVTPSLTVTAKAEGVVFAGAPELNATGVRATLRKRVLQRRGFLLAVEGGVVAGAAIGGNPGGCGGVGAEARVTTGASGVDLGEREWFAFTDVAFREFGNCRRQRLEFGAGREVVRGWWLVNQFYLERGSDASRSVKVEASVLRRFRKFDVSLGLRQEISGLFMETGIVFAIARSF